MRPWASIDTFTWNIYFQPSSIGSRRQTECCVNNEHEAGASIWITDFSLFICVLNGILLKVYAFQCKTIFYIMVAVSSDDHDTFAALEDFHV